MSDSLPGGWIIVGRDGQEHWSSGDKTESYPVLDVVDQFKDIDSQWTPGPDDNLFPHDEARKVAVLAGDGIQADRLISELRCPCKLRNGKVVARVRVRNGRLWVWVRPQRFPERQQAENSVKSEPSPAYWPAHREPNGSPHVSLTTCPACKRHAAVVITETGATLHRLGRPVFGRIAD